MMLRGVKIFIYYIFFPESFPHHNLIQGHTAALLQAGLRTSSRVLRIEPRALVVLKSRALVVLKSRVMVVLKSTALVVLKSRTRYSAAVIA